jgi:hypothetical protein
MASGMWRRAGYVRTGGTQPACHAIDTAFVPCVVSVFGHKSNRSCDSLRGNVTEFTTHTPSNNKQYIHQPWRRKPQVHQIAIFVTAWEMNRCNNLEMRTLMQRCHAHSKWRRSHSGVRPRRMLPRLFLRNIPQPLHVNEGIYYFN